MSKENEDQKNILRGPQYGGKKVRDTINESSKQDEPPMMTVGAFQNLFNSNRYPDPSDPSVRKLYEKYNLHKADIDNLSPEELARQLKERLSHSKVENTPEKATNSSVEGSGPEPSKQNTDPSETQPPETLEGKRVQKAFRELGLSVADIKEQVPEFDSLSHGKMLFVAENMRQYMLAEADESVFKQIKTDKETQSRLKRAMKTMFGVKEYRKAKERKRVIEEQTSGGIEMHKDVLAQITENADTMPEVKEARDGSLELQFLNADETAGEKEREVFAQFNQAAQELMHVPDSWKLNASEWEGARTDTFWQRVVAKMAHGPTEKQHEQYKEIKERFEAAKGSALNTLSKRVGAQGASAQMHHTESLIAINQHMNVYPDAEKELLQTKNDRTWTSVLRTLNTERGIQFGVGAATRSISASFLGLAAAPIVAGTIGAFAGRYRTREHLAEQDYLAMHGEDDAKQENLWGQYIQAQKEGDHETAKTLLTQMREAGARNKVSAEHVENRLDMWLQKAEAIDAASVESDPEAAKEAQFVYKKLRNRILYTKQKLDDGLVDFGGAKESLAKQHNMIRALGEGYKWAEVLADNLQAAGIDAGDKLKTENDISLTEERLGVFLGKRKGEIADARKKQVLTSIRNGALIGAGLGVAGWLTRHFAPDVFDWRGAPAKSGAGSAPPSPGGGQAGNQFEGGCFVTPCVPVCGTNEVNIFGDVYIIKATEGGNMVLLPPGTDSTTVEYGIPGYPPDAPKDYLETRPPAGYDSPHYAEDIHPPKESPHYASDIHPSEETAQGARSSVHPGERAEMVTRTIDPTVAGNFEVTIPQGGHLWGVIEEKLEQRGAFTDMDPGQRTFMIDAIKDKFAEMSPQELREKVGISSGNIDQVKAGETINLSPVMEKVGIVPEAAESARALTDGEIGQITENDEAIAQWVREHPNEQLTTEKVVEILRGDLERYMDDTPQEKAAAQTMSANENPSATAEDLAAQAQTNTPQTTPSAQEIADMKSLRELMAEQMQIAEQKLNTQLEGDINQIFDTNKGFESPDWQQFKSTRAQSLIQLPDPEGGFTGPAEATGKMKEYLSTLAEQTNTRPTETENVEQFMRRALEKKLE